MGWVGADVLGRPQPPHNAISFDRGCGPPRTSAPTGCTRQNRRTAEARNAAVLTMELCSLSAANGRGLCRRARGRSSGIVGCSAAVWGAP